MPNLRDLTADELDTAEAACDMLLGLHQRHHILDQETWSKIDTLHADIAAAQEEGGRKRMS
jgi:hypothetical protein